MGHQRRKNLEKQVDTHARHLGIEPLMLWSLTMPELKSRLQELERKTVALRAGLQAKVEEHALRLGVTVPHLQTMSIPELRDKLARFERMRATKVRIGFMRACAADVIEIIAQMRERPDLSGLATILAR